MGNGKSSKLLSTLGSKRPTTREPSNTAGVILSHSSLRSRFQPSHFPWEPSHLVTMFSILTQTLTLSETQRYCHPQADAIERAFGKLTDGRAVVNAKCRSTVHTRLHSKNTPITSRVHQVFSASLVTCQKSRPPSLMSSSAPILSRSSLPQ